MDKAGVEGVAGRGWSWFKADVVAALSLVGVFAIESGVDGCDMPVLCCSRKISPNGSDFGRRVLLGPGSVLARMLLATSIESPCAESVRNIFKWLFRRRVRGLSMGLAAVVTVVAGLLVTGEEVELMALVNEGCVVESIYSGATAPFNRRNLRGRSDRPLVLDAGIVI